MKPEQVLAELQKRGLKLTPRGQDIGIKPAEAVTDEVREMIRAHKRELWELLTSQRREECLARFKAEVDRVLALPIEEQEKAVRQCIQDRGEIAGRELAGYLSKRAGRSFVLDS
jgi:hypothetical protein